VALVLEALPFLFRESLAFGLLTSVTWPVAWLAFSGLLAIAWFSHRRHFRVTNAQVGPSLWWLTLLVVCPIAMLALGKIFWEKALPGSSTYAVVYLIHGILALQVATSYLFVWLRMRRQVIAIATCVLGLMWGFGTFIVSGFSITGSWP
jgi:hypothetical protein